MSYIHTHRDETSRVLLYSETALSAARRAPNSDL